MTSEQKLEAISALINGVWDNKYLLEIGYLYTDVNQSILKIINF